MEPPPKRIDGMDGLGRYAIGTLLPAFSALPEGRVTAIQAAFVQAAEDGVTRLAMCFGALMRDGLFGGSARRQAQTLDRLHETIAPHIALYPVLGLNTARKLDDLIRLLEDHAETGFYQAIDTYGLERECDVPGLKRLYRRAKALGLRLSAHVGEFSDADAVERAVVELELEEVQHGISAAASPRVMRFLVENRVRLNVCPTSNVRMGRAGSYATHPIRILYDHGVRVTVNTDDVAVFDQGVSEEFLNLYRAGNWTVEELDEIRRNGLAWPPSRSAPVEATSS